MPLPQVLVTIPDGPLKAHMFTPAFMASQREKMDILWNPYGRELTEDEFCRLIRGKDACVTGWGSPKVSGRVLDCADRLKFLGHCAGTVRWLVDESFFDRGIVLTNANLALAPSVAEYCLMTMLMARWRVLESMERVRGNLWQTNNDVVPGLNGCKIGLIGYGAITEELLRLLRHFDVEILVCSSHCPKEAQQRYGFSLCSLDEAMGCDIVSVHVTLSEATRGLIDRKKLALVRDGAIFLNTARAAVVDEEALLSELQKGRFYGVLDVFTQEPLPENHPLRQVRGAIITPHSAGTSVYFRRKMAELTFADLERSLRGETPKGLITLEKYRSMTPA